MLFLIGGASRCGKTVLARRLLVDAKVPWFSLDALRVGLTKGAPSLRLDLTRDDLEEAESLWPIVRELIENILFWDVDYLIEGSCLLPGAVAKLMQDRGDKEIRAIFLGSPGLSAEQKLALMDANRVGGNDWLKDEPDFVRLGHARRAVRDSSLLQRLAAESALPFFDTGADFATALDEAAAYLRGGG